MCRTVFYVTARNIGGDLLLIKIFIFWITSGLLLTVDFQAAWMFILASSLIKEKPLFLNKNKGGSLFFNPNLSQRKTNIAQKQGNDNLNLWRCQ